MDSVFGIGFPELVVILLLAGIVMGPQRIRQVARWLGTMTVKMQMISRAFTRQLNAELDAVDESGELRGALDDVQALRRQVEELRQELRASTGGVVQEGREAWREGQQWAQGSIQPPDLPDKQQSSISPPTPPQANEDGIEEEKKIDPADFELPTPLDVPDDPEA